MLATVNIRVAPAILLTLGAAVSALAQVIILTPAPAQATPAAPVPPAVASMRLVTVLAGTSGTAAAARKKRLLMDLMVKFIDVMVK